ncbi:hypothetical protein B0H16DRAFT_948171 [Mycena metata]|uniref:Uncharacterized protein n=1 Tax=Mycena metata TaxID=1033252 RepID=A0AAD7NVW3_9AGAR|nr:hypothetical protein B0H16DRAFT_948171 [Mycena metata]
MAFTDLPQELVDAVLDNLHDDIPTLKACSLAARIFLTSARIHLFNKIEITPPLATHDPSQQFYDLLLSSPYIAPLVDELCIVLGPETSFKYDSHGSYLHGHDPWIMTESPLFLILPLLNLKRISLTENAPMKWSQDGYSLKWDELAPELKSALTHVFSSPTLRQVHLRGIVVDSCFQLFSLFSDATALEELRLSRVHVIQGDNGILWPESRPWRPQLESLLVSEFGGDLLSRCLADPRIELTHLKLLTNASNSNSSNQVLSNLLQAASPELEHLRLWMHSPHWLPDSFGANLRSVDLYIQHVLVSMAKFFIRCDHGMHLEYITFEGPPGLRTASLISLVNTNIKSAVPKLSFLKMVRIRTPPSRWLDEFRSLLYSLVKRNLLTITEIPRPEDEPYNDWE